MTASSWDHDYLWLAEHWGLRRSKDPSTKVGAVIVRPNMTPVSIGYNGFPRGVDDSPALYEDRAEKYPRTVHAEMNAILMAREPLDGCSLYVHPLFPCANCAGAIIQAGIRRVVAREAAVPPQWQREVVIAREMFTQAGVELVAV